MNRTAPAGSLVSSFPWNLFRHVHSSARSGGLRVVGANGRRRPFAEAEFFTCKTLVKQKLHGHPSLLIVTVYACVLCVRSVCVMRVCVCCGACVCVCYGACVCPCAVRCVLRVYAVSVSAMCCCVCCVCCLCAY